MPRQEDLRYFYNPPRFTGLNTFSSEYPLQARAIDECPQAITIDEVADQLALGCQLVLAGLDQPITADQLSDLLQQTLGQHKANIVTVEPHQFTCHQIDKKLLPDHPLFTTRLSLDEVASAHPDSLFLVTDSSQPWYLRRTTIDIATYQIPPTIQLISESGKVVTIPTSRLIANSVSIFLSDILSHQPDPLFLDMETQLKICRELTKKRLDQVISIDVQEAQMPQLVEGSIRIITPENQVIELSPQSIVDYYRRATMLKIDLSRHNPDSGQFDSAVYNLPGLIYNPDALEKLIYEGRLAYLRHHGLPTSFTDRQGRYADVLPSDINWLIIMLRSAISLLFNKYLAPFTREYPDLTQPIVEQQIESTLAKIRQRYPDLV